jgi:H+-translocating NAD(P) transhydrogenase subunit beta
MALSMNVVILLYLVASVFFIQALKGLSHPSTSRRGNAFGMVGMAIAMVTTVALVYKTAPLIATSGMVWVLVGLLVGGAVGTTIAFKVEMTKMPEMVAFMHSMIGLAAVFIAIAAVAEPWAFGIAERNGPLPGGNRIELALGAFIGAITFTGSVIAFGKLAGKYKFRLFKGAPVVFPGQHKLNLALGLAAAFFCFGFWHSQSPMDFALIIALGFLLGVLLIIPIGGADMPVVVSMLNSYSGWAAAGIGFSLNNFMLIVAGSLVGSSGAILSYIMCKAMNRSFFNVILGGFGGEVATAGGKTEQRPVRSGSPDDAAFLMENAETVIIVPGYGLAVARAQHPLKELADKLIAKGVNVKYAIHPVAGRMPGHMNVLLAEAEVPYDQVFEMEDVNGEFGEADVALILGANDVVNPAAKDPKSPIAGMPILEAYKAKQVIVNKRSMASGYAGLDNELFYMPKTMMVFGDAKKVVEEIGKAVG